MATGLSVTWVAPDDVEEETEVELKCTVDDGEGKRAGTFGGTRNDEALERVVKVKVVLPSVKFAGDLIKDDSLLRACAGGVDDHAAIDPEPDPTKRNDSQYRAHTRKLDLTLTLKEEPLPNTEFSLRFEGNKGHADFGDGEKKTARLHNADEPFDEAHPWVETLKVTSDENGEVSVWVLSSDVINKPTLQATLVPKPDQEPVKIGEVECDFAAPTSKRRFVNKYDPDEEYPADDTGWLFDYPIIASGPNKQTPAKIYMKFMKNTEDGDIPGNWQYVNGHSLRIYVDSVEMIEGSEYSGNTADYAVVIDPNDDSAIENIVVTGVALEPLHPVMVQRRQWFVRSHRRKMLCTSTWERRTCQSTKDRKTMKNKICLMLILLGISLVTAANAQKPAVRPADKNWYDWTESVTDTNPLNLTSPFSSGAWGANRRIFTNPAIGAVTGKFSYGGMYIYKDPNMLNSNAPAYPQSYEKNALPNETLANFKKRRSTYHRNKPTFYLGAKGAGVTSDSGYQWEEVKNGAIPAKSWGLFMSIHSSVWSPQAANGKNWQTSAWREKSAGSLNGASVNIRHLILPGGEILTTASSGGVFTSIGPIQAYWKRTNSNGPMAIPS